MTLHSANGTPDEGGFITIYILGLCMCVLFIGGISFDLWRGFTERRELASIADAAAISAASQIDLDAFKGKPSVLQLDPAAVNTAVNAYIDTAATAEGIAVSDRSVAVVNGQVRVHLERKLDLTLTRLFAPNTEYTITIDSTAEPRVAT